MTLFARGPSSITRKMPVSLPKQTISTEALKPTPEELANARADIAKMSAKEESSKRWSFRNFEGNFLNVVEIPDYASTPISAKLGNGCVCGAPCPWGEWLRLWRAVSLGGMAASVARRVPGNMNATSNIMKVNGDYNNPSENCPMSATSCLMFLAFLMFNEAHGWEHHTKTNNAHTKHVFCVRRHHRRPTVGSIMRLVR